MKKVINYLFLVSLMILLTNCKSKKYIEEVVSKKNVTISKIEDYRYNSLVINIPLEFQLNINPQKTRGTTFYYIRNGEEVSSDDYYWIYNGESNKYIYEKGQWEDGEYYPKSIYLLDRTLFLNRDTAIKLLKRYNISAHIETIKSDLDTIKLVPYSQFRKDFPDFIEEMRKEPDSLQISIRFKSGKKVFVSERINW